MKSNNEFLELLDWTLSSYNMPPLNGPFVGGETLKDDWAGHPVLQLDDNHDYGGHRDNQREGSDNYGRYKQVVGRRNEKHNWKNLKIVEFQNKLMLFNHHCNVAFLDTFF